MRIVFHISKGENETMRTATENRIVEMLDEYMKKENISQIELANRLGWSAQDLNDTLKGRKPIGKNRQAHIADTLGLFFEGVGGILDDNVPCIKEPQSLAYSLNDDDLEIAELISKLLNKEQKKTLKAFIKSLEKGEDRH